MQAFYVIAPDLRGYGRSASAPVGFEDDLIPYSPLNRVADVLGLTHALGHATVAAVVGHDWGAPIAQMVCPGASGHLPVCRQHEQSVLWIIPASAGNGRDSVQAPVPAVDMAKDSGRAAGGRGSTTWTTTRIAKPTRICGMHRKGYMEFIAGLVLLQER